jgi:hypothetical protein
MDRFGVVGERKLFEGQIRWVYMLLRGARQRFGQARVIEGGLAGILRGVNDEELRRNLRSLLPIQFGIT